ncbi:MAG: hypothetical protein WKF84_02370 [Pyrinomonadaceae bacterium]
MLPSAQRGTEENYRLEMIVSGGQFQATATPRVYAQTGQRSFFADETGVVRGGDINGNRATAAEPPLY